MNQAAAAGRRFLIIKGPLAGKKCLEQGRYTERGIPLVWVRVDDQWPQGTILIREDRLQPLESKA